MKINVNEKYIIQYYLQVFLQFRTRAIIRHRIQRLA